MNIDLALVKALLRKEIYTKYYKYISNIEFQNEILLIINSITSYYNKYTTHEYLSIDELVTHFYSEYPVIKQKELYESIFSQIRELDISGSLCTEIVQKVSAKYQALHIINHLIPVTEGKEIERLKTLPTLVTDFTAKSEFEFVPNSLSALFGERLEGKGLQWPLQCLQKSFGSLLGGTLGHIFAPVDAGKTSLVCQLASFFSKQLVGEERLLYYCNEEVGERIQQRLYQTTLGLSEQGILQHMEIGKGGELEKLYNDNGGSRIDVYHNPESSVEELFGLLGGGHYRVVVIDIADHLTFKGDRKEDRASSRLETLYRYYRDIPSLTKKKCGKEVDVITVGQADANSAGKKFLFKTNTAESKVGKPGALDWEIGMGETYAPEDRDFRYLNITKNKLRPSGFECHPVQFNREKGRFKDA